MTELSDDPNAEDPIEVGDYVKFRRNVGEGKGSYLHIGAGYVTAMDADVVAEIDHKHLISLVLGDTMELHCKQYKLDV